MRLLIVPTPEAQTSNRTDVASPSYISTTRLGITFFYLVKKDKFHQQVDQHPLLAAHRFGAAHLKTLPSTPVQTLKPLIPLPIHF